MLGDRPGVIDRLRDVQQAVAHRLGPVLPVLLMHEDPFAQLVRGAQVVCAVVPEGRLPEGVYRPSGEIGQDADGRTGVGAAFGMEAVARAATRPRSRGLRAGPCSIGLSYASSRSFFFAYCAPTKQVLGIIA